MNGVQSGKGGLSGIQWTIVRRLYIAYYMHLGFLLTIQKLYVCTYAKKKETKLWLNSYLNVL